MKKKNLWIAGIFVVGLMMIVGIIRYIEVQRRENDPNWQIAKEIYKVENALKEVDADYECQCLLPKSHHSPILILKVIPSSITAFRPLTSKMSLVAILDWI